MCRSSSNKAMFIEPLRYAPPMSEPPDKQTLPDRNAGDFSDWLRSNSSQDGVDVPCGDCNACCRASYFIHVTPADTQALAHIPAELLFPAPGKPPGHLVMGFDQRGHCPMLENGACSIYPHRPQTCRDFDCRLFAATGLPAGGRKKQDVNGAAAAWQFSYATEKARHCHTMLKSIAGELAATSGLEESPTRIAILAIKNLCSSASGR